MAGAGRRVFRIGWNELRRTGRSFDRRSNTLLVVVAFAALFVIPAAMHRGLDFDHGLYRVAVTPGSALLPVVDAAPVFARSLSSDPAAALARDDADLAIVGATVSAPDTAKGDAALAALRDAAKDYTFHLMANEGDSAAAFPVRITLVYEVQPASGAAPGTRTTSSPSASPAPSASQTPSPSSSTSLPSASGPASGFTLLPQQTSVNTPETLSPPFPFRSLVLAYFFLIPMNFVVQVYAGSMLNERIARRGEALLASPARPWEIILGKTLPYAVMLFVSVVLVARAIGGGWLSVLAVAPLAFTFLAFQFVGGMFARSFRELTFLTVFTSVLLTIYAFLPAVFAEVHPVAFVSPITLVVLDLRHEMPTLGEALYATLPLTLVALVLFKIGSALYREEDLFHQKPVPSKAIDALARQIWTESRRLPGPGAEDERPGALPRSKRGLLVRSRAALRSGSGQIRNLGSGFLLSLLLVPFVFVAELLFVAFLFAWPLPSGILVALVGVAVVEEFFKAAPSYAGVTRAKIPARRAVAFGALVGVGFFVAEKGFLLASLVGLFSLPAGAAVFGTTGGAALAGAPAVVVGALLLGPLTLHAATASLTGWGASRGKRVFGLAFLAAVAIHTTYNYAILRIVGGAA